LEDEVMEDWLGNTGLIAISQR